MPLNAITCVVRCAVLLTRAAHTVALHLYQIKQENGEGRRTFLGLCFSHSLLNGAVCGFASGDTQCRAVTGRREDWRQKNMCSRFSRFSCGSWYEGSVTAGAVPRDPTPRTE